MSKWVEIKHNEGNFIIDFDKVFEIYIDHRHKNTVNEKWFVILLRDDNDDKSYIHCNSELEAQMVYAKLKKFIKNNAGGMYEVDL